MRGSLIGWVPRALGLRGGAPGRPALVRGGGGGTDSPSSLTAPCRPHFKERAIRAPAIYCCDCKGLAAWSGRVREDETGVLPIPCALRLGLMQRRGQTTERQPHRAVAQLRRSPRF